MSRTALIVCDMLNGYEHEDADKLIESVEQSLPAIVRLRDRAHEEGALTVYVNDNHGDFTATWSDLVENALAGRHPELVKPIKPPEHVNFIQKVRHSAFYSSSLEYMLRAKEIDTLILAGQVTEQCILYTALDAYVRHFYGAEPDDPRLYHLVVDSTALGLDACVELIALAAGARA